jgi:excisionase family DNA binding protein
LTPGDAFVDGPVVSLASPWLRMVIGRGVERELSELRRAASLVALPIEDLNTLKMLVAEGHAAAREIAPAKPDRVRADARIASLECANGATVTTMTTVEVATMLGRSAGLVRKLAKSGALASEFVGRARRFRPEDVDAYMAKRALS